MVPCMNIAFFMRGQYTLIEHYPSLIIRWKAKRVSHEHIKFWHDATLNDLELLHATYVTHTFAPHTHEGYVIGVIEQGAEQFAYRRRQHIAPVGTPWLVVILTAFIVNIRHLLYSASISSYSRNLHPLWKWLLAYLLTDEAYAVTILHYQKPGDDGQKHWYFLGAGLALWTTWQLSTVMGIFMGGHIPANWSLDFASTLTFIALVVPALKDRISTTAALTSALIALLVIALPLKPGIVIAALAGIAVGLTLELKKIPSI